MIIITLILVFCLFSFFRLCLFCIFKCLWVSQSLWLESRKFSYAFVIIIKNLALTSSPEIEEEEIIINTWMQSYLRTLSWSYLEKSWKSFQGKDAGKMICDWSSVASILNQTLKKRTGFGLVLNQTKHRLVFSHWN